MTMPVTGQASASGGRGEFGEALASARRRAGRFLAWWLGELKALVPTPIRRALNPSRRLLLIELDGEDAVASLCQGGQRQALGRLDLAAADATAGSGPVQEIAATRARGRTDLVLRLPRTAALAWRFQVPPSAVAELRRALSYQIAAETPFKADDVLFDYRTLLGTGRTVEVQAVVVPRARIECLAARLAALGLAPDIVDVDGIADGTAPVLNLLPHEKAARGAALASPLNRGLALAVFGLLVTALILPLEQRRSLSESLDTQLAEVRESAEEALLLKAEMVRLEAESGFLAGVKSGHLDRVVILDALSALLPDHTSLAELRIDGREVLISGLSASAAGLIALIDGAPLFRDPRFRASVTPDRRSGRERFSLSFYLGPPGTEVLETKP